jgi:Stigma-specific protein, Stig1
MDPQTFDRWTAALVQRPHRRATIRLLTGGLLGGLLAQRESAVVRAQQRPDRDGDGLFDDDEVEVYGTNPDNPDTDGDGTGDGEEIYNRSNGLPGPKDPLVNDNAAPPDGDFCPDCGLQDLPGGDFYDQCAAQGLTECPGPNTTGYCTNLTNDPNNCGACGSVCLESGRGCCGGYCLDTTADPSNCGFCGNICPAGSSCISSACQASGSGGGAPFCNTAGLPCGGDVFVVCCSGTCLSPIPGGLGICA